MKPAIPDPATLAKYTTKCRHCKQVFRSVGVPIIGESPDKRAAAFINSMVNHLMKEHPEIAQRCYVEQATFGGVLFINEFESNDPELLSQRELGRHRIHEKTRRVHVSDATIEEQVKRLEAHHTHDVPPGHETDPDIDPGPEVWWVRVNDIVALMKEFRDAYEEVGLHPEVSLQPAPIVPEAVESGSKPS